MSRDVKFVVRLQIVADLDNIKHRSISADFCEKCLQYLFGRSLGHRAYLTLIQGVRPQHCRYGGWGGVRKKESDKELFCKK